ncbi:MAG TPA: hypothetical protein VN616_07740 [Puia sp.]|nr:hypothetical protein [Puia sp.]
MRKALESGKKAGRVGQTIRYRGQWGKNGSKCGIAIGPPGEVAPVRVSYEDVR